MNIIREITKRGKKIAVVGTLATLILPPVGIALVITGAKEIKRAKEAEKLVKETSDNVKENNVVVNMNDIIDF